MPEQEKKYSLQEVADMLGVHKNTIKNYIHKGLLQGNKTPCNTGSTGKGVKWEFTNQNIANLLILLAQ